MEIGRRLRELRESRNLSQGDIEVRTGLLRCYTSRVENGHTAPSVDTTEKYANALGIPLFAFFPNAGTGGRVEPPLPSRDPIGVQRPESGFKTIRSSQP
jgi:transcriptional regulator with XRE-family HTH domain